MFPISTVEPKEPNLASAFKALADELRLFILHVLGLGSFSVQELAGIFAVAQPGMSHHLKILAGASLVETKREGNFIFYRRPVPTRHSKFVSILRPAFAAVDQLTLATEHQKRLRRVYRERSRSSWEFFQKHSREFGEKQKLIAEFDQYGHSLLELMEHLDGAKEVALEVGPGDGALLALLSQRFTAVVALDNSHEMLQKTQEHVARKRLSNIRFLEGEFGEVDLPPMDLVVCNMVLHHHAAPAEAFKQAFRCLKAGGAFLIADLSSHHQGWVRESCGDLWLGFSSDDLADWAKLAGFEGGPQIFQGLKNGFEIQLRLFLKK